MNWGRVRAENGPENFRAKNASRPEGRQVQRRKGREEREGRDGGRDKKGLFFFAARRSLGEKLAVGLVLLLLAVPQLHAQNSNDVDVYVAGFDGSIERDFRPCYWLNGVKRELPFDGTGGGAEAIALVDGSVYVAGFESMGDGDRPCFWVDGVKQDIPWEGIRCYAYGIAAAGGSVHVAGTDGDGQREWPWYWSNGVRQNLGLTGGRGQAQAIAVSGGNVYIAGSDGGRPCYWVNGTLQALPLERGATGGARDIQVSGNSVYVAGWYVTGGREQPCYWVNGRRQDLSIDRAQDGEATGLALAGNAVHAVGWQRGEALYWISGTMRRLSAEGVHGYAYALVIMEDTVAIAGLSDYGDGGTRPWYWVNGISRFLPCNGDVGVANAIAVVIRRTPSQPAQPGQQPAQPSQPARPGQPGRSHGLY